MKTLPRALGFVVAFVLASSLVALAAGTLRPVTTATNDPFATCTAGAGTGLSYVRSEVGRSARSTRGTRRTS